MKKLREALLGGSFNPTTIAHIRMGDLSLKNNLVDKVVYIPCGIRSDKPELISGNYRLNFLKIDIHNHFHFKPNVFNSDCLNMFENEDKILIDEFEIQTFKRIMPTSWLIKKYKSQYPNIEFKTIMGTDLLYSVKEWEEYDEVLKHEDYIIFKREADFKDFDLMPKTYQLLFDEKIAKVSSTNVRNILKKGWENDLVLKDPHIKNQLLQYISSDVLEYILKNQLFK